MSSQSGCPRPWTKNVAGLSVTGGKRPGLLVPGLGSAVLAPSRPWWIPLRSLGQLPLARASSPSASVPWDKENVPAFLLNTARMIPLHSYSSCPALRVRGAVARSHGGLMNTLQPSDTGGTCTISSVCWQAARCTKTEGFWIAFEAWCLRWEELALDSVLHAGPTGDQAL